ncbi:adhesion domain-containing protein [Yersinia rohdei]|uniref:adhesion domain-containing protein n=1 Tax=Yersinia rohdei TaxID=29485 RepID=UPI0011A3E4B3|nr:DUF823 domain-containing adhesin [Yersinia rohdei]
MRNIHTLPECTWLKGIPLALLLGLITGSAQAVLSDNTGQIQGTAPTGTIRLWVDLPDGNPLVTDNTLLGLSMVPNTFKVSPIAAQMLLDADQDSGLSYQIDTANATLSWTHNGTPLTAAQLAAPLGANFVGEKLTVKVNALVTISSITGLPTTAGPQLYSTEYTVQVNAPDALNLSLDSDTAHVEDGTIMMTATASKEGVPMPGAIISFATTGSADRQGRTSGWTGTNRPLRLNGANIGSQTFTTGPNGQVSIPVTQVGGLGVKTTIGATTTPAVTASTDVTFSVITSPDTPQANMYGHMAETLEAGGTTFKRPSLEAEVAGVFVQGMYESWLHQFNEVWGYQTRETAMQVCAGALPSLSALQALAATKVNGLPASQAAGWTVPGGFDARHYAFALETAPSLNTDPYRVYTVDMQLNSTSIGGYGIPRLALCTK